MTAIKTWAAYERLTSADLNAAFALAAQGQAPGIITPAGAQVAFTAGQILELPPGAPTAGNDQGGFWNNATKRLVIPPGLLGLYLYQGPVVITAGGAKGDIVRLNSVGLGNVNAYVTVPRLAATAMGGVLTQIAYLSPGTIVYLQAFSETVATLQNMGTMLVRLAGFGTY